MHKLYLQYLKYRRVRGPIESDRLRRIDASSLRSRKLPLKFSANVCASRILRKGIFCGTCPCPLACPSIPAPERNPDLPTFRSSLPFVLNSLLSRFDLTISRPDNS